MSENGSRRRPNSFLPEEVDGFSTVNAPEEGDSETPELAPWQTEMLDSGLRRDEDIEEKSDNLFSQIVLLIAAVLTFFGVLTCNILSKFSFITLVDELYQSRLFPDADRYSVAFVMLAIVVVLPQFLSFLLCLWQLCYAADGNNPSPTPKSFIFNALQALLEVIGLCTFVFAVAGHLEAAFVLSIMPCVFAFFSVSEFLRSRRAARDMAYFAPINEEMEPLIAGPGRLRSMRPRAPPPKLYIPSKTKGEMTSFAISALVQVVGVVAVPIYLYLNNHASLTVCLLYTLSAVCLSIAWSHNIHSKMCDTVPVSDERRPSYLPYTAKTARVKAYLFNSAFRMLITALYLTAYVRLDPDFRFAHSVSSVMHMISHSEVFTPFMIQLFVSFLGYNAARLACLLTIQRFAFAVPLLIATPISLMMFLLWTDFPFFALPSNHVSSIPAVVVFNLAFWVSEVLLLWSTAWNTRVPLLALDANLFIQPGYNSVFLEQFTLVNRLSADCNSAKGAEKLRSPEEELAASKIFICTTMYREDEDEMRQVIKSLVMLAPELGDVCEAHTFMDGGANGDILQTFALQLVHVLDEEVKRKYPEAKKFISSGKRILTPYGVRLEWFIPDPKNPMPFIIHLKDGGKVKNKKRWSQILYMYYFLQFRFPDKEPSQATKNGYILATDADVRFDPQDVKALHTLLSRDKRVGAVCGRTFPIGHGPLVWYQMFDYAIGHWFQKAAEHVLGSVLCCPGCFSMYRINALRSTLLTYGTGVDEAFDFLIKDMGEDRWLCTLLVQEGWRLDFTATASDYTHCPTGFKEFFNQRRRWIMSTLANIISLLQDSAKARRNNNSISFLFIVYQGMMLFSTVLSPATVLLVIVGGLNYALEWSIELISGILVAVTVIFIIICMGGASQENQIVAAELFTLIFAFVMGAVIIGVASGIAAEFHDPTPSPTNAPTTPTPSPPPHNFTLADGLIAGVHSMLTDAGGAGLIDHSSISVSTLYLGAIIAMFLIAGLVHLNEAIALVHGIWYILCLPGGYLFLIIYSFANLNDRSWGTREEAVKKEATATGGWSDLLTGCGRHPNESLIKFLGRALCCRAGAPPPPKVPENPYALLGNVETKEVPVTWYIQYCTDNATRFMVVCRPVEALQKLLGRLRSPLSDDELRELTEATQKAVTACPPLLTGNVLARNWDSSAKRFRVLMDADPNALPFREAWMREISSFTETRMYEMSQPVVARDDLSKPLPLFLSSIGVNDDYVRRVLLDNGYDDDTFFTGLKEADVKAMGFDQLVNGRALVRRLLDASANIKLLRPVIPSRIPADIPEWLTYLHLEVYGMNLRALGYEREDLVLLEHVKANDIQAFGITKRAHVKKFTDAIKKLGDLLFQGRKPEGLSKDVKEGLDTQDMVRQMELVSCEGSLLKPFHVRADEESFWRQLVIDLLDYRLDPIENVANLKTDLLKLRNTAMLSLIVINALWMVLMLLMFTASATSLSVLGTNPLGLTFLLLFGILMVLQFLSMLWHRMGALVEALAGVNVPFKAVDPREERVDLVEHAQHHQ